MLNKSKVYKISEVVIVENLNNKIANIILDIYYPRINNVSIYENISIDGPIMQIVKIAKNGIVLLSKVKVSIEDFITFDVKLGEGPSFPVMVNLIYVKYGKNLYLAKGEFISPSEALITAVEEFLKSH